MTGFVSACASGGSGWPQAPALHDVTSCADGGGKVRGAALNPVRGADAVGSPVHRGDEEGASRVTSEIIEANGWPALVLWLDGTTFDVVSFETDGEHIHAIRSVLNPDKLARF